MKLGSCLVSILTDLMNSAIRYPIENSDEFHFVQFFSVIFDLPNF